MGALGIDGLISQFDSTGIIRALVDVERRPIQQIRLRQTNDNNRISALQTLNANLLALSVAAGRLREPSSFVELRASSSKPAVVGVTSNSNAAVGTYTVRVSQLARAEQFASQKFDSATTALGLTGSFYLNGREVEVGESATLTTIANAINDVRGINAGVVQLDTGDYRISVSTVDTGENRIDLRELGGGILQSLGIVSGTTSLAHEVDGGFDSASLIGELNPVGNLMSLANAPAGSFVISDGAGNDLVINADLSTDSLRDLATAITQAAGDAGSALTASVEQENGSYRLRITSPDGASVVSDGDGLLQALGVLRPELANQNADQVGRNARFSVNGLEFVRSSNFVNDAINGVTLTLFDDSEPASSVMVNVTRGSRDVSNLIGGLVESYNETRAHIGRITRFDPDTLEAGVLLGDGAVRSVERDLYNMLQVRVPRALAQRLTSLNEGAGVSRGSIRLTDGAGVSATIDLSNAETLQDVVDRINRSSVAIQATVESRQVNNENFDPSRAENPNDNPRFLFRSVLALNDTGGSRNPVRVEEVNDGRTAADLGILGQGQTGRLVGRGISSVTGSISMADVGVRLTDTGSLTFNSSQLATALNSDPDAVRALFSAAEVGVAARLGQRLSFVTDATQGTIATRIDGLRSAITSGDQTVTRIETRVESMELRLRRQFTQLEITLAGLQRTSEFVQQQLANLGNVYQFSGGRRR